MLGNIFNTHFQTNSTAASKNVENLKMVSLESYAVTVSVEHTPDFRGPQVAFVAQHKLVGDGYWAQLLHRNGVFLHSAFFSLHFLGELFYDVLMIQCCGATHKASVHHSAAHLEYYKKKRI